MSATGDPSAPGGDAMAAVDAANAVPSHYTLVLYVAGQTPRSTAAIANLRRLCEAHLADCHSVEVIDVSLDPSRAVEDQIVALPTLVRRLPPPIKRIIGSLADADKVLKGLKFQVEGER